MIQVHLVAIRMEAMPGGSMAADMAVIAPMAAATAVTVGTDTAPPRAPANKALQR